jgi:hypothetical protein
VRDWRKVIQAMAGGLVKGIYANFLGSLRLWNSTSLSDRGMFAWVFLISGFLKKKS